MADLASQFKSALSSDNDSSTAALLSLRNKLGSFTAPHPFVLKQLGSLDAPFNEFAVEHLRIAELTFVTGDLHAAFEAQSTLVENFKRWWSTQKESNWGLTILEKLTLDLRRLACAADKEALRLGTKPGSIELAMGSIRDCFQSIASDRSPVSMSKKWAMLFLVNHLLNIAFKLNNFTTATRLIKTMDTDANRAFLEEGHMSERVAFRYYVGRKAMLDAHYGEARDHLTFALNDCHKASHRNKRLILIYLIPLNLLVGRLPRPALLLKYDLSQFNDIVDAVKTGNLQLLREALDTHQGFFIHWGVYLILERLRIITFRSLFKKVHSIVGTTQVKLTSFQTALQFMGEHETDLDELECIVANLIFQGYIKGYISHQHKTLVVSKGTAFPSLLSLNS